MKVYWCTTKPGLGFYVTLNPEKIMNNIHRIRVFPSILGCISANIRNINIGKLCIYYADIDQNDLIQPDISQVDDADYTGEMWVMHDIKVSLYTILDINGIDTMNVSNNEDDTTRVGYTRFKEDNFYG